jgi:hypothetical protein
VLRRVEKPAALFFCRVLHTLHKDTAVLHRVPSSVAQLRIAESAVSGDS